LALLHFSAVIRVNWARVRERAEAVNATISELQSTVRAQLISDIRLFRSETESFCADFGALSGSTADALDRLHRVEDEVGARERKRRYFAAGEALFSLPSTSFPSLDAATHQLELSSKLQSLVRDVQLCRVAWDAVLWRDVNDKMLAEMTFDMRVFTERLYALPSELKDWATYGTLSTDIADFTMILPLLGRLSAPGIMEARHWLQISHLAGLVDSDPGASSESLFADVLAFDLSHHFSDVQAVVQGATCNGRVYGPCCLLQTGCSKTCSLQKP
jgi:hypothetical protein